jgi:hypothetical protein
MNNEQEVKGGRRREGEKGREKTRGGEGRERERERGGGDGEETRDEHTIHVERMSVSHVCPKL